jgi:hypothetical protein
MNKVENKTTVQAQTKELISNLIKLGFDAELLNGLTLQQLQTAYDKNKTGYTEETINTRTSKGIHVRFLDHILLQENKRMTYKEVIDFLCDDMSPDAKTWFGLDWAEVKKNRQLHAMGIEADFNEVLYKKINKRAKDRVSTILCHDSDNNETTNKTVNKELKLRNTEMRCELITSGSLKVAIQIVDAE